jgi:hypothetical protein
MDPRIQKVFYLLGIIAALYLVIVYVLPVVLKLLGIVLKGLFTIFIWGAAIVALFFIVSFIMKTVKDR